MGSCALACCVPSIIKRRIIVETDAQAIQSRVSRPRADTTEIVINEQTIRNAYETVKGRIAERIGQL